MDSVIILFEMYNLSVFTLFFRVKLRYLYQIMKYYGFVTIYSNVSEIVSITYYVYNYINLIVRILLHGQCLTLTLL